MSRSFAMMDYGWRFTIVNYVSKSFSASNDRMIAKCLDLGVVHEILLSLLPCKSLNFQLTRINYDDSISRTVVN